jgi:sugar phosphate permease
VLSGCLACQVGLGFSYIFSTFLKDIVDDFGWSRAGFALGASPMLLAYALASPVVGGLTDRHGARRVLTGASLLLGLSLVCFGAMQEYWHFAVTTFLFGFALTGLGDIPVGAVAARWFERGRGLALGVIYTGSNIGGAIVPIVASLIAAESGWRTSLFVLAGVGVVFLLPFALFTVRGPRPGEVEPAVEEDPVSAEGPSVPLSKALRTRTFWILAFALFVFYFYYVGVIQHLIAFLRDQGMSREEAAGWFGLTAAIGVAGKLGMGLVADRIPTKTALLATFGLVTLASFLLLRVDAPGILVVFLLIHGFSVAAENVLLPLIVAECFGVLHMASIYGALMVALLPGGALGPVFAGWMYDTRGSYELAFVTFAAVNVVSLVALAFVRREQA